MFIQLILFNGWLTLTLITFDIEYLGRQLKVVAFIADLKKLPAKWFISKYNINSLKIKRFFINLILKNYLLKYKLSLYFKDDR